MRLKVSPKEALKKLDKLIKDGYALDANIMELEALEIKKREQNHSGWFAEAEQDLVGIFLDFAPVFRFLRVRDRNVVYHAERSDKMVKEGLEILLKYYDEVSKYELSPLRYVSEKAEIWLYDICCMLKPETNESELCKYMFQFGFGEYQEIAEIHKHITGGEYDPRAKDGKAVLNAIEGINLKAKQGFGFALLSKKKSVVALSIPSQFILSKD